MAEPVVPVSLRMSPEGAARFKELSRRHRELSQGMIVECMVNYLMSDMQLENRILKGEKIDFFGLLGDAFLLAQWGDHAFRKGWMPWSVETYTKLDESAKDVEGIQQIARFRLGSSWVIYAMQMREQGLLLSGPTDRHFDSGSRQSKRAAHSDRKAQWNEYYMCAVDGLLVAIAYHRLFNQTLNKSGEKASPGEFEAHPVVLFNESCAWSLTGQYVTERNAGPDSDLAQRARQDLEHKKASDNIESGPARKKKEIAHSKLDAAAQLAVKEARSCVERISTLPGQSFGSLPVAEIHWLVNLAKHDLDLEFLRTEDSNFGPMIASKEKEVSLIKSFYRLRERVPKEVEDLIPKLPSDT